MEDRFLHSTMVSGMWARQNGQLDKELDKSTTRNQQLLYLSIYTSYLCGISLSYYMEGREASHGIQINF
jgi:hypothetical protein